RGFKESSLGRHALAPTWVERKLIDPDAKTACNLGRETRCERAVEPFHHQTGHVSSRCSAKLREHGGGYAALVVPAQKIGAAQTGGHQRKEPVCDFGFERCRLVGLPRPLDQNEQKGTLGALGAPPIELHEIAKRFLVVDMVLAVYGRQFKER